LGLVWLTLWTFVQTIPLPRALIATLAPSVESAYAATAAALGLEPPGWIPLSLDAPATLTAWISLAGGLAIYLLANDLARSRHGPDWMPRLVPAAGLALVAVGAAHAPWDPLTIYGFYEPTSPTRGGLLRYPLVNANHAAALLLLAYFWILGKTLTGSGRPAHHRYRVVATLLLGLGVVASCSRASTVLLVAGTLAVAMIAFVRRREHPSAAAHAWRVLALLALLGTLVVLLVDRDRWWLEVARGLEWGALAREIGGISQVWEVGATVAGAHLWTGAGHGAFAAAAPGVMVDWSAGIVDYAHHLPFQILADWGLVGIPAVACMAFGFLRSLWLLRDDLFSWCLGIGVLLLVTQNHVDFSLWIPGVGYAALLTIGYLAGSAEAAQPASEASRGETERPSRGLVWGAGLAATWGVACWAASAAAAGGDKPLEEELRQAYSDPAAGVPEGAVARIIEHPTQYRLMALMAALAHRSGQFEGALKLAERAVELAPHEPVTRLARARLHLLAGRQDEGLADLWALHALKGGGENLAHDEAIAFRGVPGLLEAYCRRDPAIPLGLAGRLHALAQDEDHDRVLAWAIEQFPDSLELHEALGASWAARPERSRELGELATRLLARAGNLRQASPEQSGRYLQIGYLFEGIKLTSQERHLEAYHMYAESALHAPQQRAIALYLAARELFRLQDYDRIAEVLPQFEAAVPDAPKGRRDFLWSEVFHYKSLVAEHKGQLGEAIQAMHRALLWSPKEIGLMQRLADLFGRAGDLGSADRTRERILLVQKGLEGSPKAWMNPRGALESAAARGDRGAAPDASTRSPVEP
jgi:Flp pilus assembly protein TadD